MQSDAKGDYITDTRFHEMLNRWYEWIKKEGSEPNFIWIVKPTGWVNTGYFEKDIQNDGYSCGPSSLQMALHALKVEAHENVLEKWAGTVHSRTGTSNEGMLNAIKKVNEVYKTNLSLSIKSFKETGWEEIKKIIKDENEIVIHLRTGPLAPVWQEDWGHYVYLVGVNLSKRLVKIADPAQSKSIKKYNFGIITYPFSQFEKAMAASPHKSVLILGKK